MLSLYKRFKSKLIIIWVQIRDIYLYLFRHAIILNGYVDDLTWSGIQHRNWGDDLNYYFIQELTKRPVVMYHNFKLAKLLHLKNYLCIGTLLDATNYSNSKTIVWGSGVCGADRDFTIPQKTLAVRGYKTLEFLKDRRYPYPKIVGDPALMLSKYYTPKSKKKYKLGVIPHVIDLKHEVVNEIQLNYPDVIIINLAHYNKWTDVIDQIYSCDKIISSSLHGLIVSDTYQIPNCWVEFSGKIAGGHFKFLDYASSVKRNLTKPIKIESLTDIKVISDNNFENADLAIIKDIQNKLLANAPFRLKNQGK